MGVISLIKKAMGGIKEKVSDAKTKVKEKINPPVHTQCDNCTEHGCTDCPNLESRIRQWISTLGPFIRDVKYLGSKTGECSIPLVENGTVILRCATQVDYYHGGMNWCQTTVGLMYQDENNKWVPFNPKGAGLITQDTYNGFFTDVLQSFLSEKFQAQLGDIILDWCKKTFHPDVEILCNTVRITNDANLNSLKLSAIQNVNEALMSDDLLNIDADKSCSNEANNEIKPRKLKMVTCNTAEDAIEAVNRILNGEIIGEDVKGEDIPDIIHKLREVRNNDDFESASMNYFTDAFGCKKTEYKDRIKDMLDNVLGLVEKGKDEIEEGVATIVGSVLFKKVVDMNMTDVEKDQLFANVDTDEYPADNFYLSISMVTGYDNGWYTGTGIGLVNFADNVNNGPVCVVLGDLVPALDIKDATCEDIRKYLTDSSTVDNFMKMYYVWNNIHFADKFKEISDTIEWNFVKVESECEEVNDAICAFYDSMFMLHLLDQTSGHTGNDVITINGYKIASVGDSIFTPYLTPAGDISLKYHITNLYDDEYSLDVDVDIDDATLWYLVRNINIPGATRPDFILSHQMYRIADVIVHEILNNQCEASLLISDDEDEDDEDLCEDCLGCACGKCHVVGCEGNDDECPFFSHDICCDDVYNACTINGHFNCNNKETPDHCYECPMANDIARRLSGDADICVHEHSDRCCGDCDHCEHEDE